MVLSVQRVSGVQRADGFGATVRVGPRGGGGGKEEARGGGREEKQSEIERCGFTRGRKGRGYVYEWILAHESAENNARVGWDFDRVVYEFRKVCV